MRYLEIRRHTMRYQPGEHINQAGVDLARRVGDTMGTFNLVMTSRLPRAFETAIAMGYAVDEQNDILNQFDGLERVEWNSGFAGYVRAVQTDEAVARSARAQATYWRAIAAALPEDGRALLITHGGLIEAGAAACLPAEAVTVLGGFCDYCEGVLVACERGEFVDIVALRV